MKTKLFFVWLLIIYNQANASKVLKPFLKATARRGLKNYFTKHLSFGAQMGTPIYLEQP
jgi:hypothetical protein